MSGFMGNYVEVKDRIPEFWDRFPDGRIVSQPPQIVTARGVNKKGDEVERTFVLVTTAVYRGADDELPVAQASSMEPFPGETNFTRDSEAENAETSAIGRALGSLGIGIQGAFASADEVRNRQTEREAPQPVGITPEEMFTRIVGRLAERLGVAEPTEEAKAVWKAAKPKAGSDDGLIYATEQERVLGEADSFASQALTAAEGAA